MPIMKEACRIGREILDIASKYVCKNVTGDQIDKIVTAACKERNIYPSPLNYYAFPKSLCVSANEVLRTKLILLEFNIYKYIIYYCH